MIALADQAVKPSSRDLTPNDQATLKRLEQRIEKGIDTFKDVGYALLQIKEQRLYRERYGSFKAYCSHKWGFTRQRAHQLVVAAKTIERVSTMVDIPEPENERQVRALASVPEDQQVAVWKEAVESAPKDSNGKHKVTAEHVRKVADKVVPVPVEVDADDDDDQPADPEPLRLTSSAEKRLDGAGDVAKEFFDWSRNIGDAGYDLQCLHQVADEANDLARKWREVYLRASREAEKFQPADFMASLHSEVKLWLYHAPAEDRRFIVQALRQIADEVDVQIVDPD